MVTSLEVIRSMLSYLKMVKLVLTILKAINQFQSIRQDMVVKRGRVWSHCS